MTTTSGNPAAINAIIQFTSGTGATWNSLPTPVPAGLVTLEMDTGIMKRGDGVTLYANLPMLINLTSLIALMTNAVQKGAGAAQAADLQNTGGVVLFGVNGSGNVVTVSPAQLWTWLVNNSVLKSVGGVVNVGP